jgi:hypothetical protein
MPPSSSSLIDNECWPVPYSASLLARHDQGGCRDGGETALRENQPRHTLDRVQAGTMRLQLRFVPPVPNHTNDDGHARSAVSVHVGLAPRAHEVCHGASLPLSARSDSSSRYHAARDVHWAFAVHFADSILADAWAPSPLRNNSHHQEGPSTKPTQSPMAVTAMQVYAHIDNAQLQAALKHCTLQQPLADLPAQPTRRLAGLVPTVQPYQAHAVE